MVININAGEQTLDGTSKLHHIPTKYTIVVLVIKWGQTTADKHSPLHPSLHMSPTAATCWWDCTEGKVIILVAQWWKASRHQDDLNDF